MAKEPFNGFVSGEFVRRNEQIRIPKVLLICENENMGIMPTKVALDIAKSKNLDLVEISPYARPPVCKIMDFGKFQFEQRLKEKKHKKKQSKQSQTKEVRLSPAIQKNDLETKLKSAIKFLNSGYRVAVKLEFKRRELAHQEIGFSVINDFIKQLDEHATVVSKPKSEGKNIFSFLEPKKKD